jgi:hypothetical protein
MSGTQQFVITLVTLVGAVLVISLPLFIFTYWKRKEIDTSPLVWIIAELVAGEVAGLMVLVRYFTR